jgi:S-adenosylmethionine-dependent methyltransferase
MTGDAPSDVFNARQREWRAWQNSPWGRLRYSVVRETLSRVCADLGDGPLRVLDVGGANGGDALPLAARGHEVTVLDYSSSMLDEARDDARALGVGDRLHTIHAGIDDIADQELTGFDLVLCHNVLQYRENLAASLAMVVSAAAPGGAVSLIGVNPASDVLSAAVRREDPVAALELLDAESLPNATFGHEVRAIDAGQTEVALTAAGCQVFARFGIRCVTDYIVNDARKSDPAFYADLERLELALCDREPFIGTARMWQLVARTP